jgi:polyhydroxyalkanoate synthesis regulator phasin
MLKEAIFTAIGAGAILKEKVEEEIQKLEENGKIKADDAKSFLKSIEERGKEEDDKIKQKVKETIKEVFDELGVATKDDLEKLREELTK